MRSITKMIALKKRVEGAETDAFNVQDVGPTVLAVGVAAIIGAVILLVLNGFVTSSTVLANSATANALNNGIGGIGNIFAQFPLLGTIIGLMLILGVVLFFFYNKSKGDGL